MGLLLSGVAFRTALSTGGASCILFSDLIVKDDIIPEFVWNVDLDFCSTLVVTRHHGLDRLGKLQTIVEEDRPDEWKRFELFQGDGCCQQLPVWILCPELLYELVWVSEEVVFVILVPDFVLLLAPSCRPCFVIDVFVQHQVSARRMKHPSRRRLMTDL